MVDFEAFVEWAESRFGNIKIKGDEIRANSVFHPFKSDTKFRLWMKPSGTTKKGDRSDGVYHCFDTNQKGTLVGLVMTVDKCTYSDACDAIGGGVNLAKLEKKVAEFFNNKHLASSLDDELNNGLALPKALMPLSLSSNDPDVIRACKWLQARNMPVEKFFVGIDGRYRDRIVIPYYDKDGNLIYYNGRALNAEMTNKYLGPPKELGIGKDDVVYMYSWPAVSSKIYITEGEFDSIVLNQCGFYAAALGGKNLSDKHLDLLAGHQICLALDSDDAGKSAMLKMYEKIRAKGMSLSYVAPPKTSDIKDWNDLYLATDKQIVKAYIQRYEKEFTDRDFLNMSVDFLSV